MTQRYRVEVSPRPGFGDGRGQGLRRQMLALGVKGVTAVDVMDLYFLAGTLDPIDARRLADALLCDTVVEQARIIELTDALPTPECTAGARCVEVALRPGVTDSVADRPAGQTRRGSGGLLNHVRALPT